MPMSPTRYGPTRQRRNWTLGVIVSAPNGAPRRSAWLREGIEMKNRVIRLVAPFLLVCSLGACQADSYRRATGQHQGGAGRRPGMHGCPPHSAPSPYNQSGLGVTGADGEAMAVEWPFGYTARNQLGTTVLVDEKGKVVAKVGDEISVGGGLATSSGMRAARSRWTRAAS